LEDHNWFLWELDLCNNILEAEEVLPFAGIGQEETVDWAMLAILSIRSLVDIRNKVRSR
jgi:hypothetical protein